MQEGALGDVHGEVDSAGGVLCSGKDLATSLWQQAGCLVQLGNIDRVRLKPYFLNSSK